METQNKVDLLLAARESVRGLFNTLLKEKQDKADEQLLAKRNRELWKDIEVDINSIDEDLQEIESILEKLECQIWITF